MRKTWGKPAAKLFSLCGNDLYLNTTQAKSVLTAVDNSSFYTPFNTQLLRSQKTFFKSVRVLVLPTFHTTYNNNYLNKLNIVNLGVI